MIIVEKLAAAITLLIRRMHLKLDFHTKFNFVGFNQNYLNYEMQLKIRIYCVVSYLKMKTR